MCLEVFLSISRNLGHQKYPLRPTKYTSIKLAENEILTKGRGGEKNVKNHKKLKSSKMRLEVFLSIRQTLAHKNYALRPTKYSSIKFAKNEIFPKGCGGEKISKNLNLPKCA